MIVLPTKHPGFDLDMEILCSIPVEPGSVSLRDLAIDFALGSVQNVRSRIENLRTRGYRIHTGFDKVRTIGASREQSASINDNFSRVALKDSENYWHSVPRVEEELQRSTRGDS